MKKIILMLLVLLCGMSLFAEVQEFYVGIPLIRQINSEVRQYFFPAKTYKYYQKDDSEYLSNLITYFTKIKPVGDYYEVELMQGDCYFTFLVKKGDKLGLPCAESRHDASHIYYYNMVPVDCCIVEIKHNYICIDFVNK